MELKFDQIDELMKKYGYHADKELQYFAFMSLLYFNRKNITVGQDIYATCLEGPPGAGKSFYAETYVKLVKDIYNEEVSLIEYQCDATTGKNELYEDINISAAIKRDADNVNIPGKLVQAIKEVNKGKKVVLFIDEYDKAKEETDAFLLQFLQSGKLNTTQYGDLGIKNEYSNNIQVILCKNDFREELSGPLTRRLRMISLDYMKPTIFNEVAKEVLITKNNNKVSEGLINLVSLIYNVSYENKDVFLRLPSCSEMLIAISDADKLMKYSNATKDIIYKTIIRGIFKNKDDVETFENGIADKNNNLKKLINEMKENNEEVKEETLVNLIANTLLKKQTEILNKEINERNERLKQKEKELDESINEVQAIMEEYEQKVNNINPIQTEEKKKKLKIGNNTLEFVDEKEEFISNFEEEELIKRGKSIFSISEDDFAEIGSIEIDHIDKNDLVVNSINRNLVVYENGVSIFKRPNLNLVLSRKQMGTNQQIKFFTDSIVIPIEVVTYLLNYINKTDFLNNKKLLLDTLVYIKKELRETLQLNNDKLPSSLCGIKDFDDLYRLKCEINLKDIKNIEFVSHVLQLISTLNEEELNESIDSSRKSASKILSLN